MTFASFSFFALIVLLPHLKMAQGTSGGSLPYCKVYGIKYGCVKFKDNAIKNSLNRNCPDCCLDNPKPVMFWADPPVFAPEDYALRTANDDNLGSHPTEYVPGDLMKIWIKVLKRDSKYRGLLMHAVAIKDKVNATVGEFEFPEAEDDLFWTPKELCPQAVMHLSAIVKPYSAFVRFRAPPPGTGTIVIQALIKKGPANRGSFYYAELALTEKAASPSKAKSTWSRAAPGQSCTEYCANRGEVCLANVMGGTETYTAESLESAVSSQVSCAHPLMWDGCNKAAPLVSAAGECFYHDQTCYDTVDCDAVTLDGTASRFCACGTSRMLLASPAPIDSSASLPGNRVNSMNLLLPLLMAPVVAGFSLTTHNRPLVMRFHLRQWLLLALVYVVLLSPQVHGHNWYRGESRSRKTAQSQRPCAARVGETFHAQVGPEQLFAVAWALGHGGWVTMSIMKAEDAVKVKNRETYLAEVQDYIANAPAGSNLASNPQWQRYRGTYGTASPSNFASTPAPPNPSWGAIVPKPVPQKLAKLKDPCPAGQYNPSIETSLVCAFCPAGTASSTVGATSSATCISCSGGRYSTIGAMACDYTKATCPVYTYASGSNSCVDVHLSKIIAEEPNAQGKTNNMFPYTADRISKDQRFNYKSAKHPHILHASYLPITDVNFEEIDQVFMQIPPGSPPGHYIVFWDWEGYNDCMDVELRSDQVRFVNGEGSTDLIYKRIEHCQYVSRKRLISACHAVAPSAEQCINELLKWPDTDRIGVNVVPLAFPDAVPAFLAADSNDRNTPWSAPQCGGGGALKLTGTVTRSAPPADWESTVAAKLERVQSSMCKTVLWTKGTLMEAVLECTPKICVGIATSSANPAAFVGCSATKAASADWSVMMKKNQNLCPIDNAPVPAAGKCKYTSYADDLRFLTTSADFVRVATISFQSATASATVVLPAGAVADTGDMYGARNGLEYGWAKCKHTLFSQNPAVTPPTVESTSANYFFELCGLQTSGQACPSGGWAGLAPPEGCSRNKWELLLQNGWYKVSGKQAWDGSSNGDNNRGCSIEGTQMNYPQEQSSKGAGYFESIVQVQDGKLTIEDSGHNDCCKIYTCYGISSLTVEKLSEDKVASLALAALSLMPGSDSPWWQVDLGARESVGFVTIKQVDNQADCRAAWLYDAGTYCFEPSPSNNARRSGRVAAGYFATTGTGAVVGVSDTPCSGTSCTGGQMCGRVEKPPMDGGFVTGVSHAVTNIESMRHRLFVDCGGKSGRYVFVQLPGKGRILLPQNVIEVHRYRPLPTPENRNKFVCFGVVAPEFSEATPEYEVTDDPEDPIFYSTCLVRERNLVFLPPQQADRKVDLPFKFNGRCLSCKSYRSSLHPLSYVPTSWEWTEKCFPCDEGKQYSICTPWNTCSNNGKCFANTKGHARCKCSSDFYGPNCQHRVVDASYINLVVSQPATGSVPANDVSLLKFEGSAVGKGASLVLVPSPSPSLDLDLVMYVRRDRPVMDDVFLEGAFMDSVAVSRHAPNQTVGVVNNGDNLGGTYFVSLHNRGDSDAAFTVTLSALALSSCRPGLCKQGGTCSMRADTNFPLCSCPQGTSGSFCETDLNDVVDSVSADEKAADSGGKGVVSTVVIVVAVVCVVFLGAAAAAFLCSAKYGRKKKEGGNEPQVQVVEIGNPIRESVRSTKPLPSSSPSRPNISDTTPSAPPKPSPPPAPWEEVIDESSGRKYYFNPDTGESVWKRPA